MSNEVSFSANVLKTEVITKPLVYFLIAVSFGIAPALLSHAVIRSPSPTTPQLAMN